MRPVSFLIIAIVSASFSGESNQLFAARKPRVPDSSSVDGKSSPNMAVKYLTRARNLRSKGMLGESLESVKKALVAYPGYGEAWLELGDLHMVFGASDKAMDALNEGIPLAEDQDVEKTFLAKALAHRARINVSLHQPDAASKDLLKILSLMPKDPTPHQILGEIHAERGRFDAAIESFKRALKLDQKNPSCWMSLGKAAIKGKNRSMAVQAYLGLINCDTEKASQFAEILTELKIPIPDPKKVASFILAADDPYASDDDPYADTSAPAKVIASEKSSSIKKPALQNNSSDEKKSPTNVSAYKEKTPQNTNIADKRTTQNLLSSASSSTDDKIKIKVPETSKPSEIKVINEVTEMSKVSEASGGTENKLVISSKDNNDTQPEKTTSTTDLLQQLSDPDETKKSLIRASIAEMGEKAIPDLTRALKHHDPKYRMEILSIFAGMGDTGKIAIREISSISTDDPDPTVREKALSVISVLESKRASSGDFN
ncbi:MAG: tetratricopeptide repeat protein [Candidatus Riflebacteria bacterium]|nr:tetratricopeptide repeat protein [Candidatus Riflebacteria bacterium]